MWRDELCKKWDMHWLEVWDTVEAWLPVHDFSNGHFMVNIVTEDDLVYCLVVCAKTWEPWL